MKTVTRISIVFCFALLGCSESPKQAAQATFGLTPLTEIPGTELKEYVATSQKPVLVEFGVDFNCGRCESMKPDMAQIAEKYRETAHVVRVDFTNNVALVSEYGGSVCPTYVLFDDGQPVLVQSFPTSVDLLESALVQLIPSSQ